MTVFALDEMGAFIMIDLSEVGAFASDPTPAGVPVRFGLYLPGIGAGFQVVALVIHSADRFTSGIQPQNFPLQFVGGPNGLWSADVTIQPQPGTSFGQPGRYLYRYQLYRVAAGSRTLRTLWFTDPFARATDEVGQLSAFDTPASVPAFQWHDGNWKVPELADLVVYEMHVEEFNSTFQHLVDSCHSEGVAVILDVVFQHVDPTFPYYQVYLDAGVPSPMTGGQGPFGPVVDYSQQFARDS